MRDYASHQNWDAPQADKNARLRWVVIGVAALLLIVLYAISHHGQKKSDVKSGVAKTSVALSGAKATTQAKPVQFDFYQMLTKNQPTTGMVAPSKTSPVNPTDTYYVQIGRVVDSRAVAEQQKANLILSGIASNLIKIVPNDKGTFKVVLGPYDNLAIATAERTNLSQGKISGLLIKSEDLKK